MPAFLSRSGLCAALALTATPASADFFLNDVTISDSLCVGTDCLVLEAFGPENLKLKSPGLSILFDDTSDPSGTFPSNDWRLIANEVADGGREMFAIEDATAGSRPFLIEAGAAANALYVAASGLVGLGTSMPLQTLHAVGSNTPALRLEQDGAGGFTPYVWDVRGNERGFWIRDVTAQTTPFEVAAGAADGTLVVTGARIGVGTATPQTALHVVSTEGVGNLLMEDTGGRGPLRMLDLRNDGAVQLYMNNTTKPDASWLFSAGRSLYLSPTEDAQDRVFELSNTGNITIDGTLTQSSDKRRKTAIEPVDPQDILDKVAAIPVAEWTYIADAAAGTRHIGPMAQDFHAAFGLGADATGISSLDGNGVALAAIQALLARVETLEAALAAR